MIQRSSSNITCHKPYETKYEISDPDPTQMKENVQVLKHAHRHSMHWKKCRNNGDSKVKSSGNKTSFNNG